MPVRCALGCERRRVHRFPNPFKYHAKFKAWVNLMGGRLEGPEDHLAYQHKRICGIHFTEKDYNRNNRLNASAVPSQHLPAWCVLPPMDSSSASTSSNIQSMATGELSSELQTPQVLDPLASACSRQITVEEANTLHASPLEMAVPTFVGLTSKLSNDVLISSTSDETIESPNLLLERNYIGLEHNYCLIPKVTKKCSKPGIPSLDITKMKALKRQIRLLKHEILRLRKRGLSYKARLANAHKISDHVAFRQVTRNMTEPAKLLTLMNFRESAKKSKGRRFTVDEKNSLTVNI